MEQEDGLSFLEIKEQWNSREQSKVLNESNLNNCRGEATFLEGTQDELTQDIKRSTAEEAASSLVSEIESRLAEANVLGQSDFAANNSHQMVMPFLFYRRTRSKLIACNVHTTYKLITLPRSQKRLSSRFRKGSTILCAISYKMQSFQDLKS